MPPRSQTQLPSLLWAGIPPAGQGMWDMAPCPQHCGSRGALGWSAHAWSCTTTGDRTAWAPCLLDNPSSTIIPTPLPLRHAGVTSAR